MCVLWYLWDPGGWCGIIWFSGFRVLYVLVVLCVTVAFVSCCMLVSYCYPLSLCPDLLVV